MIETLKISNFRGFKEVHLEGLRRFNVLVGPNASGKTALLEALFMLCSRRPEVALSFRAWRGMGDRVAIGDTREAFEGLWRDLFFRPGNPITLESLDSDRGRRRLTTSYGSDATMTIPLGATLAPSEAIAPLLFEWTVGDRVETGEISVDKEAKQLKITTASSFYPAVYVTAGGAPKAPNETVKRFSDLSKAKKHGDVVEAVRRVFPFVRDLTSEIEGPDQVVMYADIEGRDTKVPLPLVSDGINRYLSLLVAVTSMPSGVVIVDEIETGFYYATLPSLLQNIMESARANNTQLFMSTHSIEFLNALRPLIEKYPEAFRLLRTRRDPEGCAVHQVEGDQVAAALEEGFEIR